MSKSKREIELEVEVKYLREHITEARALLSKVIADDFDSALRKHKADYKLYEAEKATDVKAMRYFLDRCK